MSILREGADPSTIRYKGPSLYQIIYLYIYLYIYIYISIYIYIYIYRRALSVVKCVPYSIRPRYLSE